MFKLQPIDNGVRITWDAETLIECHFPTGNPRPYYHPIRLPGSPILTAYSPCDHVHHQGLWFAWKKVNGVNFWEQPKSGADPRGYGRIVHRRIGDESVTSVQASFVTENTWIDWEDTHHLHDVRETVVHKPQDKYWYMDLRLTLTADARDVVLDLARGNPGQGGCSYSGLTVRFDNGMTPGQLLDAQGRTGAEEIYGQSAPWCGFSGTHPADGQVYGVTIIDHPDNPRYPTPWWVRNSENYALIGASACFHQPLEIASGNSVHFTYRIVVHRGAVDPDTNDRLATATSW